MTFEHGRIKTWRLPRFSAFEMDAGSRRTSCKTRDRSADGGSGAVCVAPRALRRRARPPALPGRGLALRRPASSHTHTGPAGGRRNSSAPAREPRSLRGQPCTSGAATARSRLGPAAAAFCRLLQRQRVIAKCRSIRPAAAENFDAVGDRSFEPSSLRGHRLRSLRSVGIAASLGCARLRDAERALGSSLEPGRAHAARPSRPSPDIMDHEFENAPQARTRTRFFYRRASVSTVRQHTREKQKGNSCRTRCQDHTAQKPRRWWFLQAGVDRRPRRRFASDQRFLERAATRNPSAR